MKEIHSALYRPFDANEWRQFFDEMNVCMMEGQWNVDAAKGIFISKFCRITYAINMYVICVYVHACIHVFMYLQHVEVKAVQPSESQIYYNILRLWDLDERS